MKRKQIKALRLKKVSVSNLEKTIVKGGATYPCSTGPGLTSVIIACKINCDTLVPDLCN